MVAAVATAILALATYWLARTTREELKETRREITATEKQAEASTGMLAEVQIDRDLNWRPYLVVTKTGLNDVRDAPDTVYLKNIGRGPAFNCVCARLLYLKAARTGTEVDIPVWHLAPRVQTIEAGGEQQFSLQFPNTPVPMVLFEGMPAPPAPIFALFFQDIVGKRAYRLVPPSSAPDVWTPGDPVAPWVSWYFGHLHMDTPT